MKPGTSTPQWRRLLAVCASRLAMATALLLAIAAGMFSAMSPAYAAADTSSTGAAPAASRQILPPVPDISSDINTAGPYGPGLSIEVISSTANGSGFWDTMVAAGYNRHGSQYVSVTTEPTAAPWPGMKVVNRTVDGELSATVTYPTSKGIGKFVVQFRREVAQVDGQKVAYGQPTFTNMKWWPEEVNGAKVCVEPVDDFGIGAFVWTADGAMQASDAQTGLDVSAGGRALVPVSSGITADGRLFVTADAITRAGDYPVTLSMQGSATRWAIDRHLKATISSGC
jgi:hypothetical protein